MLTGISGFISGVILLYFCIEFINSSLFFLKKSGFLLAVVFSFAVLILAFISSRYRTILFAASGLILGFCYAYHVCFQLTEAIIPANYDNQNLQMTGFLCALPKRSEFSYSAEFCITALSTESGQILKGSGYKAFLHWPLEMDVSRQVRMMRINSRHPRATVNFVGLPYEANLFYKEIVLTGKVQQVLQENQAAVLTSAQTVRYHYHQARLDLAELSDRLLAGTTHLGMLRALLLGDRSRLSVSDHKLLGQTGTQHLIAISGLHVGIVMLGLYLIFPKTAVSLGLVAALGGAYVFLVGFGPSAQRAWVMCLLGLLYAGGYLKQGKWQIFLWALFIVLLIGPLAPLNLGFWFSFICVAILMLIAQNLPLVDRPWLTLILLQCLVMLGLSPLYSYLGLQNGLANILANIMAIPWISLLILPLALSCFVFSLITYAWADLIFTLAKAWFNGLDVLLEVLMAFLDSLSIFRAVCLFDAHILLSAFYMLSFLAMLGLLRFYSVFSVSLLALLLILIYPSRLQAPVNEFLVFDSGQGLAIAMSFQGQTWLYDTGPAYGRSSVVAQVLLPYLRARQLDDKVAGLIVSHGDADHAGDIVSLLKAIAIPTLLSGESERLSAQGRFQSCSAGMIRQEQNASIEVLYPFKADTVSVEDTKLGSATGVSSNNRSCVLRFSLFDKTFLVMGDLEAEAEMQLVQHYRQQLKADVLIAGHHGAPKGSSYALLKHVQPDFIVFSAGYLNAFGHPSVSVLKRTGHFQAKAYNTALSGALRFEVDAATQQRQVSTARQDRAAFWLSQPLDE